MPIRIVIAVLLTCLTSASASAQPATAPATPFRIGDDAFLLDGKPFVIKCGELHFARIPREYWRGRLKLARAMGLNTVCAYLFWNAHEPRPGEFDFTGVLDAAEFCRIAQQEDLKVILRPGPYACAEWEFGGHPWWLLKDPQMKLRTTYPGYFDAAEKFMKEVGKQLAPLQVTRGGPIILVQVENEYGSYGSDGAYISDLAEVIKFAGFDVPLFTCDSRNDINKYKHPPGLFAAVNFGSDPSGGFQAQRRVQPTGPLIVSEYYPGWFDSWGKPHHTGEAAKIVGDLRWMLEHKASFSIYMVHGGTTFGFMSGANAPPFSPESTSYDYDAPIDESGRPTKKYFALRELLSKHVSEGEKPTPAVPEDKASIITIPRIELSETSPMLSDLPEAVSSEKPMTFESLDQPYGCVLYRAKLTAGPEAQLAIREVHDYAIVLLDGKRLGTLDRRFAKSSIKLPARAAEAQLDVLVHAFGRVNFGRLMLDHKGITDGVEVQTSDGKTTPISNWQHYKLPLDDGHLARLKFAATSPGKQTGPAFFRGSFKLDRVGDTFLDTRGWGLGFVWINGHNLGRFWSVGPQQTLYAPGPFLKQGENEITVLELNGCDAATTSGLDHPILDQVQVDSTLIHRKPNQKLDLAGVEPVYTGSFPQGSTYQTAKFAQPATGRYLCLETLSAHDKGPFAAVAEIQLVDRDGKDLPRDSWSVAYADSEEVTGEDGNAANVFDNQPTTFWHTQWNSGKPPHPHQIVIDLGAAQTVTALRYLPRPQNNAGGRIKDVRIYLSEKPFKGLEP